MAKYLDSNGLLYLWGKIKTTFLGDVSYDTSTRKLSKTKNGTTSDLVTLSTVATSGSYNDLSNKPTIPTVPSAYTSNPAMDGTASAGSSTQWAKGDHVHPSDTSRAPVGHASSSDTYGKGTSSNYGHVKLSDAIDGTSAAAGDGTAATPKAVSDALQAAYSYADSAVGTASAGALQYKGAVTAESAITGAAYKKGWYWIVAMPSTTPATTSITIGGIECEAGDMVIAKQDKTSTLANDIDVIQSNIAVITNAEIDAIAV